MAEEKSETADGKGEILDFELNLTGDQEELVQEIKNKARGDNKMFVIPCQLVLPHLSDEDKRTKIQGRLLQGVYAEEMVGVIDKILKNHHKSINQ